MVVPPACFHPQVIQEAVFTGCCNRGLLRFHPDKSCRCAADIVGHLDQPGDEQK
jgi:hypothetical protein